MMVYAHPSDGDGVRVADSEPFVGVTKWPAAMHMNVIGIIYKMPSQQ